MATEFILITGTAEVKPGVFLEMETVTKVHYGAAQDMDLFLHTRPLFLIFVQLQGKEESTRCGFVLAK